MFHDKPVVYVVDDDVSVRESLSLLVESAGWSPRTFGAAREFLASPPVLMPGCMVLDVHLPDLSGLDLQALIADRTYMPIVFITGHGEVPTTVRAMKAGAVEFLTKPLATDILLGAIRSALARSCEALAQLSRTRALWENYRSLSHRQQEVMSLVVAGHLNKQVGGELGISEITVKAHRGQIMRKMKARSLPELVRMALTLDQAPINAASDTNV